MISTEIGLTSFAHAKAPYDPQKRREYYLRTRELKGRKRGTTEEPVGKAESRRPSSSSTSGQKGDLEARRARSKERREEVKARVEQLERKLSALEEILKKKVAEAKLRSGGEPPKPDTPKAKTGSSEPKRKLSATEKRKAAERAEEAREKEQKTSPAQEVRVLERKIAETRLKIKEVIEEARAEAKKVRDKTDRQAETDKDKTKRKTNRNDGKGR